MNTWRFLALMAVIGYAGGSLVGWGLSEREVRMAMCSYYSEWDFCKEVQTEKKMKDLAIEGLSREVYKLKKMIIKSSETKEVLCVKAYRLNVRLYPLDGKVIDIYRKGKRVTVIDRIGGWVRTQDGWVSERYLGRCNDAQKALSTDKPAVSGGSGSSAGADRKVPEKLSHNSGNMSRHVVPDKVLKK